MTTSQSVFAIGDVVLANPKEAATLLSVVVLMAVGAQYSFRALRRSKTASIRMVFASFSNSLLTIGAISLIFSFASQAVAGINERWLLLLRWSQVVLLTLLLQLFCGTIVGTTLMQKIWNTFQTTEEKIPSSTYSQALGVFSSIERSFVDKYSAILHIVFVKDVAFVVQSLAAAAAAAAEGRRRLSSRRDALRRKLGAMLVHARDRDEVDLQTTGTRLPDGTLRSDQDIQAAQANADLEQTLLGQAAKQTSTPLLLSAVLQNSLHTQMSDLVDITWQSWLMLIFLIGANSVRMFALPGKLQSKPVSEFTIDDRTLNVLTFIGLVGWIPTALWLIALALFIRNFRNYTTMADSVLTLTKDVDTMGAALEAGRVKVTTGSVWLPPEQRDYDRHRLGDSDDDEFQDPSAQHQLEDPSMYFLRGNRNFTLHALRVPMLMVEMYTGIFFIGMIGDVASTFGPRLVYVIPVALLPLLIVWLTVPIGVFILAVLSSLGSRLGEDDLAEAFLSSGEWRELLGDEVAIDEHGVDNEYGKDIKDEADGCVYCEERLHEMRQLESKVRDLEKLCRRFGLRVGEYRGAAKHQERPSADSMFDDDGGAGGGGGGFVHSAANFSAGGFEGGSGEDEEMQAYLFQQQPSSSQQLQPTAQSAAKFTAAASASSFSPPTSLQKQPSMAGSMSGNSRGVGGGATTPSATALAPTTVQAAAFEDQRQREIARALANQKREEKKQAALTQQELIASLTGGGGGGDHDEGGGGVTPRDTHHRRASLTSSHSATLSARAGTVGGGAAPAVVPLLSTSALAQQRSFVPSASAASFASPSAGNNNNNNKSAARSVGQNSAMTTPRTAAGTGGARGGGGSAAAFAAANATGTMNSASNRQAKGNDAMVKNVSNALRYQGL